MAGLRIRILDLAGIRPEINTYSDAQGCYQAELAAGAYRIWVTNDGSRLNIPHPDYFQIDQPIPDLTISGDTIQDITLRFVRIAGKTTDSNGVPVPNVSQTIQSWGMGNYSYSSCNSDADGQYLMLVTAGNSNIQITPPNGSGFIQISLNDLNTSSDLFQNIILNNIDTHAPLIIAGPYVTSITDSSAVVEWQTNEPATGRVKYGADDPPVNEASVAGLRTNHAVQLTGLTPNTTYYFQALSSDGLGNGPTGSAVSTFATLAEPDRQAPVILDGPIVTSITHSSAVVEWTTDEPSTGEVQFGSDEALGQTAGAAGHETTHRIKLTGLSADSLYFVRVSSSDTAGNGPHDQHDSILLHFGRVRPGSAGHRGRPAGH